MQKNSSVQVEVPCYLHGTSTRTLEFFYIPIIFTPEVEHSFEATVVSYHNNNDDDDDDNNNNNIYYHHHLTPS